MHIRQILAILLLAANIMLGCQGSNHSGSGSPAPSLSACPVPGRARAARITDPAFKLSGPDALAGVGDYLLMNDRAVYAVQGVDQVKTYYYYGGILIDAAALADCRQAGPEQFEELGLFVGTINASNPYASGLRAFRGQSVEIVNDGSDGGDAVVRVHGVDDIFWIVELTMIRTVFQMGAVKPYTPPFGLSLYVDYILPPDSSVLRIEFHLQNNDATAKSLMTGTSAFFGDGTVVKYFSTGSETLLNYQLDTKLPFIASSSGTGAWAFAMKDASMSTANIAGLTAMLDSNQMAAAIPLAPAGEDGDSATVTYYFSVGGSDFNSALVPLHEINPNPLPDMNITLHPLEGRAYDLLTGEPIANAQIELQNQNALGEWKFIDGLVSGPDGTFAGQVPDLGLPYRLVAHAAGRPDPAPPTFLISDISSFEIGFMPGGTLLYDIRDPQGRGLPVKIILWKGGQIIDRIFSTTGSGANVVPPGVYDISVTRGFEYTNYQGSLEIKPDEITTLQTTLTRAVDTTGFLSMDGHLHAGPSADNVISIPDRIATVAAEGLEVAVSTDHEIIVPWQSGIDALGLGDWVATVLGQEVTATVPEHSNMYPVPARPDLVRGGPVAWYGLDLEQIWAAMRARGAGIVQLNHPRNGCNYMCLIKYNRLTGTPTLTDPTVIGLPAGAHLWSWDFDVLEYQNGNQDPFLNPFLPDETGTLDDWLSFLNLGHRITAVANTDAHDWEVPGCPRTYFASPTDRPAEFQEEDLVAALREGRALASTGAFARVQINSVAGLGDLITDPDGSVDLWVHVEALPEIDVTKIKVLVNCTQVANVNTTAPNSLVKYDGHLTIPVPTTVDSHVVVLGLGTKNLPRGFPQFNPARVPRFTANAIYIDANGNGIYDPPGGRACAYTVP